MDAAEVLKLLDTVLDSDINTVDTSSEYRASLAHRPSHPRPKPARHRRLNQRLRPRHPLQPKYTGYMVYNRRQNPRRDHAVTGKVNPPKMAD
jgi:hypothetical protein